MSKVFTILIYRVCTYFWCMYLCKILEYDYLVIWFIFGMFFLFLEIFFKSHRPLVRCNYITFARMSSEGKFFQTPARGKGGCLWGSFSYFAEILFLFWKYWLLFNFTFCLLTVITFFPRPGLYIIKNQIGLDILTIYYTPIPHAVSFHEFLQCCLRLPLLHAHTHIFWKMKEL